MSGLLYVAFGGGLGAALRYGCGLALVRHVDAPGLWSTLLVNVTGSLAMGVLIGWLTMRGTPAGHPLQLFLGVGLLGGFTTYSAYALETGRLLQRGAFWEAGAYAIGTMAVCVLAFLLGAAVLVRSAP